MKKNALLFTMFLAVICKVSAQDSVRVQTNPDRFKAGRNSFSTELNVNPFRGEISLNNAFNQLKFRYFPSDGLALRLAFTAASTKNEKKDSSPYGTNPQKFEKKKKATTVGVNFGFEKHFAGTKRLSPYIGAEAALAVKSSSHDIVNTGSETHIKGAWQETVFVGNPNNPYFTTNFQERAFTRYGLNVLTGFDFYMAKHFYLGYEVTFGFASTQYKDIDVSTLYTSGGNPSGNNNTDSDDKDFSFGPSLVNGIRVGYVF